MSRFVHTSTVCKTIKQATEPCAITAANTGAEQSVEGTVCIGITGPLCLPSWWTIGLHRNHGDKRATWRAEEQPFTTEMRNYHRMLITSSILFARRRCGQQFADVVELRSYGVGHPQSKDGKPGSRKSPAHDRQGQLTKKHRVSIRMSRKVDVLIARLEHRINDEVRCRAL